MREKRARGRHDVAARDAELRIGNDDCGRLIMETSIHAAHPCVDHVLVFAGGLHEQCDLQGQTKPINLLRLFSVLWEPQGTLGLEPGYGETIAGVAAAGPAALAGIVVGDRIALASTPFDQRRYLAGVGATVPIGTVVRFNVIQRGVARDVVLTSVPSSLTPADKSLLLFECLASLGPARRPV